jgi:hypothetical protein
MPFLLYFVVIYYTFCTILPFLYSIFPQDALLQHVRRAVHQSSIWTTSRLILKTVPSPDRWGWMKDNESWTPVWMTIPEAARAWSELIKCGCRSEPTVTVQGQDFHAQVCTAVHAKFECNMAHKTCLD